jgi:hypothetical protein
MNRQGTRSSRGPFAAQRGEVMGPLPTGQAWGGCLGGGGRRDDRGVPRQDEQRRSVRPVLGGTVGITAVYYFGGSLLLADGATRPLRHELIVDEAAK